CQYRGTVSVRAEFAAGFFGGGVVTEFEFRVTDGGESARVARVKRAGAPGEFERLAEMVRLELRDGEHGDAPGVLISRNGRERGMGGGEGAVEKGEIAGLAHLV